MTTRSPRSRDEWRVVAAAVGVLLAGSACSSGDGDGGATTTTPARVSRAVAVSSYRVSYEVVELDRSRQEHVVVRRPYESRRTSVRGGAIVSGTLTNAAGLWHWIGEDGGGWQLVDPGRRRAEADARPLAALPPLVEGGLAVAVGSDRVVGRPCTVVRTAAPVGSPAAEVPTDDRFVELCLDRTGVMLRERWVIDGRTARRQEAVAFETDGPVDDHEFAAVPAAAAAPSLQHKQLIAVTDDMLRSLEVAFDLPPDIAADGAEAWLLRDPAGGVTGGSVQRFYRRGHELAEVEERTSDEVRARGGVRVRTPLGTGSLHSDLHHLTLHVPVGDGVTVVVRSSNAELLDDLVEAMARQDRTTDEAGLPVEGER